MSLDFAEFLLNYTERFFLKGVDMLTLCISLVALFVSMAAIIMTLLTVFPNEKTQIMNFATAILIVVLIPLIWIFYRHLTNNPKVFKIEKTVFLNYDWINQLGTEDKKRILDEFKKFYDTKGKNVENLINLLSKSPSDQSQTTKRSWCDWFWNGGER